MAKVITFFGADSKTGTSMIAQSVAELLAEQGKEVLMLFASAEYGDDYIKGDFSGCLDDLKRIDIPLDNEVDAITNKKGNLSFICGIRNMLEIGEFTPDFISRLISAVNRKYHYIIIDGGHNIQYPLPIGALTASGYRYYVITQNEKTVKRFQLTKSNVLNAMDLYREHEKIIVNKVSKKSALYSGKQIEELFGLPVIEVPELKNGQTYELQKKTMLDNKSFAKSLLPVIKEIMADEYVEKKGFFRK